MNATAEELERVRAIVDSLSKKEWTLLQHVLDCGFNDEAARELFDEGEAEGTRSGATTAEEYPGLLFLPSSLRDLECFAQPHFRDGLKQALLGLRNKLKTSACVRVPEQIGWILRDGPYRVVFRIDADSGSPVVLGITNWAWNPMLKVWRYLDQTKAEDLVRTGKLYFRRADLLEDEYEATPTLGSYLDEKQARRRALPGVSESEPIPSEALKHCTFVCCWRICPHESWLAWKHYCSKGGGFAVQTTSRKLFHLAARLNHNQDAHCRDINYIDHRLGEFEYGGLLGEPAFYKALWFSDERETRLVRFHHEYLNVKKEALEANPALIPECDRIECDLGSFVERIVMNPFATEAQTDALTRLIEKEQPALSPRVRRSAILRRPVGVR